MRIQLNGKEKVTEALYLGDLIKELQVSTEGIAVAVGKEIISRSNWDTFSLNENDEIILISATRGG